MANEETIKHYEELNRTWESVKSVADQAALEVKKAGELTQETKNTQAALEKHMQEIEAKLAIATQRPALAGVEAKAAGASVAPEVKAAFGKFMRQGEEKMAPEELRYLATDSDQDGGLLLPENVSGRVIETLVLMNPIRQYATIETISLGRSLKIPKEGPDDFGAGWVGERESRPQTSTGKLGAEEIPAFEMYAAPRATQSMLDDTAFNVEGWIARKVAQKFQRIEGQAFLNGDGIGKPEGLLTHTGVPVVVSGNANLITPDGLITMVYDLPEEYAVNAVFLMRRAVIGTVRLFKDQNDQYIWQPGVAAGEPATLLGYKIAECPDMPTVAANTTPIMFGDLREAYTIVDKGGIRTLRDPYTVKPFIEFYTTRHVGGQVVQPAALRKLKVST